jgi:L-serine dehydratase
LFNFSKSLPYHPNALTLTATLSNGKFFEETYYSVGGGFVVKDGEVPGQSNRRVILKYPANTSAELMKHCETEQLSVSQIVENEEAGVRNPMYVRSFEDLKVMTECYVDVMLPNCRRFKSYVVRPNSTRN